MSQSAIEQGSPEWFEVRRGKVTASRIADVMATVRSGGSAASRRNYMAELIVERLTGATPERFTNAAMQWGTETEPQARTAYEFYNDVTVQTVGFVDHPSIRMSGASPDGFVGEDGLVEIKCPNTATHIETLLAGDNISGDYVKQMQWQMACTGRQWCDFVSFDPRLPERMSLHVVRVNRDPVMIADLEAAVRTFLAELDDKIEALEKRAA